MTDAAVNTVGLVTRDYGAKSRSISSLSGVLQLLMAANPLRKSFSIQNTGNAEVIVNWKVVGGVGLSADSVELAPGDLLNSDRLLNKGCTPVSDIWVMGTSGQTLFAEEWLAYGGVVA